MRQNLEPVASPFDRFKAQTRKPRVQAAERVERSDGLADEKSIPPAEGDKA
jgi:hypothetical protein